MERDDKVFIIGEEVAEYQGAYKVKNNFIVNKYAITNITCLFVKII